MESTVDALPAAHTSPDLLALIQSAAQLPDGPKRDAALLEALRICRQELEDAEAESEATQLRLSGAKYTFECASKILSGVATSSLLLPPLALLLHESAANNNNNGKRGSLSFDIDQHEKRAKTSPNYDENENMDGQAQLTLNFTPVLQPVHVSIPSNPIHIPSIHTSVDKTAGDFCIMSEQDVTTHRENFYQKLLGISASDVDIYTPNLTQANLRSKSQLAEGMHIVRHWDTGADGLDAAAFRSRHKSWYTKMKPLSHNLGRRTGIHLRTLGPQEGEGDTVLCRYNKDATKSIPYLDTSQLYDALFELHCLEHNHARGNFAVKFRADELYANVPEGQVKAFVDTCVFCLEKKGGQQQQEEEELAKMQIV